MTRMRKVQAASNSERVQLHRCVLYSCMYVPHVYRYAMPTLPPRAACQLEKGTSSSRSALLRRLERLVARVETFQDCNHSAACLATGIRVCNLRPTSRTQVCPLHGAVSRPRPFLLVLAALNSFLHLSDQSTRPRIPCSRISTSSPLRPPRSSASRSVPHGEPIPEVLLAMRRS